MVSKRFFFLVNIGVRKIYQNSKVTDTVLQIRAHNALRERERMREKLVLEIEKRIKQEDDMPGMLL